MTQADLEQACWTVIEQARQGTDDFEAVAERVEEILAASTVEAIVAYDQACASLQTRSYTWALWGAAYLINGGCSDDGFDYFRGWLLTQGRAAFEAAMTNPDSLDALLGPDDDDVECEDMLYVAGRAYETLTGEELDGASLDYSDLGEGWDFDDGAEMKRRYPKLWAKFGWDNDG